MSDNEMTPERIAEIKDLLKYESSIAFYSSRAKESMLLLVDEAEEAAKLRKQVAELESEPRVADIIAWLYKKAREYRGVTDRQESASDALARMADKLSRGAVRPRTTETPVAPASQHFDKVPDPLDGCHWCACGNRWPCKHAAVTA
jgi:hypothetical protein